MARIYRETSREDLRYQELSPGRRWVLSELSIQRAEDEAAVHIVVIAQPGVINPSDELYDDAARLMRDVLKPRHRAEADTIESGAAYMYDQFGNETRWSGLGLVRRKKT